MLTVEGMAVVLGAWGVLFAVLVGMGLLVHRLAGLRRLGTDQVTGAAWMGLVVMFVWLQVYHLGYAVRWPAMVLPAVLGAAGWVLAARQVGEWARWAVRTHPVALLVGAALVVWCSNLALDLGDAIDEGIYHQTAMRWTTDHPITRGLANLLPMIGFNSSSWLYDAVCEIGPLRGLGNNIAVSSISVLTLLTVSTGVRRLLDRRWMDKVPALVDMVLLCPVIHLCLSRHMTSFTTDQPAGFVLFVAGSRAFRFLAGKKRLDRERVLEAVLIGSLASLAVTIKLSTAVFGAMLWALIAWRAWADARSEADARTEAYARTEGGARRRWLASTLWMALPSTALIGVWMVRGVMLSGRPLFPLKVASLPVEWLTPDSVINPVMAWLVQYARLPDGTPTKLYLDGLGLGIWVRRGWRPDPLQGLYPVLLCAAFAGACAVAWRVRRPRPAGWEALILIPALAGVASWFFTAPSPRFGFSGLWLLLALATGVAGAAWLGGMSIRTARCAAVICFALMIPPVTARVLIVSKFEIPRPRHLVEALFRQGHGSMGFWPAVTVEMTPFITASGLRLNVPMEGQSVYDMPLPATPYPDPGLRLLKPEDPWSGFALDGDWKGIGFPAPDSEFMRLWREREAERALRR